MTLSLDPAVERLLNATNSGDIAGFLAAFTEDGVVDDWGREFRGHTQIRSWSDAEFIGREVKLDIQGVEEGKGETIIAAEVGGKGYTGPSHFAFRIEGDHVTRMTISG